MGGHVAARSIDRLVRVRRIDPEALRRLWHELHQSFGSGRADCVRVEAAFLFAHASKKERINAVPGTCFGKRRAIFRRRYFETETGRVIVRCFSCISEGTLDSAGYRIGRCPVYS